MPSLVVEALANVVAGELGGLKEGDLEAHRAAAMTRIWECAGWRGRSVCVWEQVRHSG